MFRPFGRASRPSLDLIFSGPHGQLLKRVVIGIGEVDGSLMISGDLQTVHHDIVEMTIQAGNQGVPVVR